jgi:hypothetical protein
MGLSFEKAVHCEIPSFRRGVVEVFALLGCYEVLVGRWKLAVEDDFLDCLNLEGGTDRPSRNVSNYQPTQCNIPEDPRPQQVCYFLITSFVSE